MVLRVLERTCNCVNCSLTNGRHAARARAAAATAALLSTRTGCCWAIMPSRVHLVTIVTRKFHCTRRASTRCLSRISTCSIMCLNSPSGRKRMSRGAAVPRRSSNHCDSSDVMAAASAHVAHWYSGALSASSSAMPTLLSGWSPMLTQSGKGS
jgi:hypothetical protein